MDERLLALLRAVQRGEVAPEAAAAAVARETDLGFAVVDDERARRTGLPEVVFGESKTPDQLAAILRHVHDRGMPALATRVDAEKAARVRALVEATYEEVPRLLWIAPEGSSAFVPTVPGTLVVACAGTSDLPVAEEAARCAEFFGLNVRRVTDVGVAGLHRLLARVDVLREADAIIVVAGMEGALPSVVAGLTRAPIVAVPTSVGYGAQLGGLTTMLAMLTSCAGGIAVVNIDNGFGAAQVAWRMLAGRPR